MNSSRQVLVVAATVGSIFTLHGCGAGAGPCKLGSLVKNFEVDCTIPSSTTITPECCSLLQGNIDKYDAAPGAPPRRSQQDAQNMQTSCRSFSSYMQKRGAGHGRAQIMQSLPDGLTCTEKVKGAGESACQVNAKRGNLAVTCEIPKETKISPECCKALNRGINKVLKDPDDIDIAQEQKEVMNKCPNFMGYVQKMKQEDISGDYSNMPPGSSCTETVSGGDLLALYANRTIISSISLAAGGGSNDVSDEAIVVPSVVSGMAGFLVGGTVVAGLLLRCEKKQQGKEYALLSA